MYSYVNKINVGTNPDKTEVVLSFLQESPQFETISDEEGNTGVQTTLRSQPVADIVVTGSFAKEIAKLILSITGE